jgi:hypothetical protein
MTTRHYESSAGYEIRRLLALLACRPSLHALPNLGQSASVSVAGSRGVQRDRCSSHENLRLHYGLKLCPRTRPPNSASSIAVPLAGRNMRSLESSRRRLLIIAKLRAWLAVVRFGDAMRASRSNISLLNAPADARYFSRCVGEKARSRKNCGRLERKAHV